ncbi:MAG: UDP-3-O-(3-hydroxymyristoyl)glucosamine N-acyltransferase [Hyphomicrobiaceae bacterium]
MEHPGFFQREGPFSLDEIARATGASVPDGHDGSRALQDVRPLSQAGPGHLTFIDNRKYLPQLAGSRAGACLVAPAFASRLPPAMVPLLTPAVYRAFAQAMQLYYPDAMRPKAARPGLQTLIDPSARLEAGAEVEPGAVIGAGAEIGRGTRIAAGAVIGYRCMVGRDCYIGPGATVTHALLGNRVIIHTGVRIGQDGFGFAMGAAGHLKVPQIGRVVVQDDVEIGANTCIDRGALSDTVIGEGTKIDNLVQIGHNVMIGRHCVIVGQCGIAGSARLDDYVVMGGQSGAVGHIRLAQGTQVAGGSHVKHDTKPGERLIGTPAKPIRDWMREALALQRLAASAKEPAEADPKEPSS